jgi:Spy/CpxP family protein refolding chaperone
MNSFRTSNRFLPITTIGIAVLGATVALAQPPGYGAAPGYGPPAKTAGTNVDWAQARLDRMAWRFNLTAEQKAKLKPILEQRQALRTAQRQAMRNELAQILTPQQLAQWDQPRGSRGGRGLGRGPCGGGQAFGAGRGYGQGMGYGRARGFGPTN